MHIRQETQADRQEVENLIQEAFETAEHRDGKEHHLVAALRVGSAFVPELSLVAEIDGKLAGQILLTEGKVGSNTVLILAPLSVRPAVQRMGVGSALIKEAHKIARSLGYQYALVLGSEHYYPRFGYLPAEQFGVIVPDGMPSPNFMAIQLQEHASPISGAVTYAKEFGL